MAQEATPIIRRFETCRAAYGGYPPSAETAIGCLPRNTPVVRQGHFVMVAEWLMSANSGGAGYKLMRHLDGKAMLMRRCAIQACRWIYDPGDGKPAVEVKLAEMTRR